MAAIVSHVEEIPFLRTLEPEYYRVGR